MGACLSKRSFSSKGQHSSETIDISMSLTLITPPISIRTFRELSRVQMSKPMWRKTETSLILVSFRSMADQLEEVANLPTTHMPRQSIQGRLQRP
ncbi:AC4 protein [Chilli leaf curl Gonda virus]|uniref:AC4 protein n=1 Tax=Chilli leaf curl Gonda virus TaxID=2560380 RepID=A0A088MQ09_9GEMI|nr:AC4 protein [Chilli leaf curl Gonda virus]AIN41799.1 AC4 protein [Chilli leaf curl Gonda virus]